jgi:hypothetical protein
MVYNFNQKQFKKLFFNNLWKIEKNPEGYFVQLSSEAMKKVAFPQFEENQKKPEGCF